MIAFERLAMLALGELDEGDSAEVEEHLLTCGACAATFESLLRIGKGVRDVIRAGKMVFPTSAAIIDDMETEGLITRSYRLVPDGVVACTVGAADICTLTTLEADLRTATRVDVVITLPWGPIEALDLPFDAQRGLVTYVARADQLRMLPSVRIPIELSAYDAAGARRVSRYFLDHQGFAGQPPIGS